MKNQSGGTLKKAFGLTIKAAFFYQLFYQINNSIVKTNPGELELDLNEKIKLNWIASEEYADSMKTIVNPYLNSIRSTQKEEINHYPIEYDAYLVDKAVSTVVIVHGFNEYKEKFHEIIYYLLQADIQVFVYDQRGHGNSKLEKEQSQIDIATFTDYVSDLKAFIEQLVTPNLKNQPLVLFGHSMGGAVVTALMQEESSIADAVILNAPMLDIDTGSYPKSFSHLLSKIVSQTIWANKYIPSTEAFDPNIHSEYQVENDLTSCYNRGHYYHEQNLALHPHPTQGGSYRWLAASLDANWKMRKKEEILKIEVPVLLFRAELDSVVKSEGLFTLNKYLPNVLPIVVPNAKHEIFQENDEIVQPYMSMLINFIQQL